MANVKNWLTTSDNYLLTLALALPITKCVPFVWRGAKASVRSCSVFNAPPRISVVTVWFLGLLDIEPDVGHRHSLAEPFLQLAL